MKWLISLAGASTLGAGALLTFLMTREEAKEVSMEKQGFVSQFLTAAKEAGDRYGIPAVFILAQAGLESGWGSHVWGFNFFGIKAGPSWRGERQLLKTWESHNSPDVSYPEVISVEKQANGTYLYHVRDWFRKYPDPVSAFEDHAALLARRWQEGLEAYDPYHWAAVVSGENQNRRRYATDPNYRTKLNAAIGEIEGAV